MAQAALTQAAIKAVKILKDEGIDLKVIHQSGKQDFELVKDAYQNMGIDADVSAFIDDMASAYQRSTARTIQMRRHYAVRAFGFWDTGYHGALSPCHG